MRVWRTFAFMDLSGFTQLTDTRGDECAVSILSSFRGLVRETCSRRGVRIAKWLGDGAMLVCVETAPVLATVLELQLSVQKVSSPLELKCGVTAGPVILLEGDDYIGHAVNVAARLCDLAHGYEILAVPEILPDLPKWAKAESGNELEVRGLERPLGVVRLSFAARPAFDSPDPVCGIPLSEETAFTSRRQPATTGAPTLFCSESCLETWMGRPDQSQAKTNV